jgi:hypothetical protein
MDKAVSPFMQKVYKYLPPVRWRIRAGQMDYREAFFDAVWDGNSDLAQLIRDFHKQKLENELPNRKDLWEKLTPTYNPGCKRIIITDDYFPALGLPNVALETRPIDSISGNKIKVKGDDGTVQDVEPEFDLLVCATGFKTVEFMHPINMTGRNGRSIRDVWKDGAEAYYGTCVEDMPNFAMLYGPNTNLGHNSIILMIESQSRYINGLIKPVIAARTAGKALSLTPKTEKVKEYNVSSPKSNTEAFVDFRSRLNCSPNSRSPASTTHPASPGIRPKMAKSPTTGAGRWSIIRSSSPRWIMIIMTRPEVAAASCEISQRRTLGACRRRRLSVTGP